MHDVNTDSTVEWRKQQRSTMSAHIFLFYSEQEMTDIDVHSGSQEGLCLLPNLGKKVGEIRDSEKKMHREHRKKVFYPD